MYENELMELNDNYFNHYINHFGDGDYEYRDIYIEIENIELDSEATE